MLNDASVRIVDDVCAWLAGSAGQDIADAEWARDGDAASCLEILLEARANWLDRPDPTLWRTGDAHRLLIDTAAVRLADVYGLAGRGAAVLATLVDYLDAVDRFHPSSMRTATLRKELDRAAAKFPAAMADETTWGLAKRVLTAMRAEGVDLDDADAVDAWGEELSQASADRRRMVLGTMVDHEPRFLTCQFVVRDTTVAAIAPGQPIPPELRRHDPDSCPDCADAPPNPPIQLPPAAELADAARACELLRALAACAGWAGDGRAVTKRGLPSPADTRSLAAALGVDVDGSVRDPRDHLRLLRIWQLALDVEVLRLHRTAVVAGPTAVELETVLNGGADPERVLALWADLADRAVSGSPPLAGEDSPMSGQEREFLRPWGPRALGELYRAEGPTPVGGLVDELVADHHGQHADEMLTSLVGAAVRTGLLAGVDAGLVSVAVAPGGADEIEPWLSRSSLLSGEPAWAIVPVPGTIAELTPLGRHLVRLNLLAEGTPAPLLA